MFFEPISYCKYLLKSSNQHGVHSPFVYDFVTKCLYKKTLGSSVSSYKLFLKTLQASEEIIDVADFGAGSKIFKSNSREIAKIAKVASINKKHAFLLMRMIPYFNLKNCLELGTSLGVGAYCIAKSNDNVSLTTIEGCPNTAKVAQKQLRSFGIKNVSVEVGMFEQILPRLVTNQKYDLVLFDGNHTKEATWSYFDTLLTSKHNDSIFIFDDIHWSKGMTEVWEQIKMHPEVTVTIDLFKWGIVFFRKEQRKEHFTIRF